MFIYYSHIFDVIDIVKKLLKVFLKFLNLIILNKEYLDNTADSIVFFEKIGRPFELGFNEEAESIINFMRKTISEVYEVIKNIIQQHPNDFLRNLLNQFFSHQIGLNNQYLNDFYLKNICFDFDYENKDFLDLINKSKKSNLDFDILKEKITCFRIKLIKDSSQILLDGTKNKLKTSSKELIREQSKKAASQKRFTLVLDLDETLIHFEFTNKNQVNNKDCYHSDGVLHLRPGLNKFLECLTEHYELIIFTLGTPSVILLNYKIKKKKIFFFFN